MIKKEALLIILCTLNNVRHQNIIHTLKVHCLVEWKRPHTTLYNTIIILNHFIWYICRLGRVDWIAYFEVNFSSKIKLGFSNANETQQDRNNTVTQCKMKVKIDW